MMPNADIAIETKQHIVAGVAILCVSSVISMRNNRSLLLAIGEFVEVSLGDIF
jgi:hypothetical protein